MDDYRFNLKLPAITKDYLKEIAWMKRTTITQYLVELVQEDMKKNIDVVSKLKGYK